MDSLRRGFALDPSVTYLNHGAFGATPLAVTRARQELEARLEREPIHFLVRELPGLLDAARAALGAFVGADPEDLVFVRNATEGVNTVLASLADPTGAGGAAGAGPAPLGPGDQVLVTSHGYNACNNAARFHAARAGAEVVVARLPFPVRDDDALVEAVLAAVTPRTRLALLDHVTSPSALVLPLARLVAALAERGVDTLVDGAHAPGMLEVDLDALGAAYYTANLHKWVCAPKGAAFLHVRRDRRAVVRPLCISHGANSTRTDRSRFHLEFDWTGTFDPSAALAVPATLEHMASLLPGGWPALRARNHALALEARALLCAALGVEPPCPPHQVGSLFTVPLPPSRSPDPGPGGLDALSDALYQRHRVEVPVMLFPAYPARAVRPCAQLYNELGDYQRLADALRVELAAERA